MGASVLLGASKSLWQAPFILDSKLTPQKKKKAKDIQLMIELSSLGKINQESHVPREEHFSGICILSANYNLHGYIILWRIATVNRRSSKFF